MAYTGLSTGSVLCPARGRLQSLLLLVLLLLLHFTWWRHPMETFSALLAICAGNSPVTGEFHAQRPVTRSFDVFFDLRLNRQLRKQWRRWWFETLPRSLWRYCNVYTLVVVVHFIIAGAICEKPNPSLQFADFPSVKPFMGCVTSFNCHISNLHDVSW